ncbi:MAG TPA: helix-turn-helix transcriptional regulator [Rubrobacter sp.]|nr:helix-turn-helix transcriptional regulator [Rubrobacter sp.]
MSTSMEERTFREIKRLCYMGLDANALGRRVAARLRRAVPFDVYGVSVLDPLSGLPTDFVYSEEMADEREAVFYMRHIYFDDDVTDIMWLAREQIGAMTLAEATRGKLERALRHREVNVHKGLANEMRCAFSAGGELWGGICVIRERGAKDFEEREVSLIKRLSFHIASGFRAATLRRISAERAIGDDSPGVVLLDAEGRLTQYTPPAKRLLRELGAEGEPEAWRDGAGLPPAVWAVAGALRRSLGPEPRYTPRVCARASSGRLLTLQASLGEAEMGRPPETVIVMNPAGPVEALRLNKAVYGLSPREEEVSDLLIRGSSTREISRSLHISEYTVQDHLKNIFGKIGIKSRRELLKRLFLDTMMPGA